MLSRSARIALLSILALIFPAGKLILAQGTVPPGACLFALDPTAANAFQIAGAQSVYTACGVVSESSSSSAFEMEGSETLYLQNHAQVSVVGGANLTGQTYLYDTISGKDVSAVRTTNPGDPLSSLSPPTTGTVVGKTPTYYDMNSKPANNTISPGIYCGGLTIGNTNGTTFTFSPGIYIMAGGGLTLNSLATVKGTGVTFYITSSSGWGCSSSYSYKPITISGEVNANLTAPTSGSFDGVIFFGNRTGCSTVGSCVDQINGGSTAILNGALYFKSDEIEITGANASGYTMLVADKIYINGNSTFAENGSPFDDITVSVSPAAASLYASQTQQFTATVNNTGNTAVTWTISPTSAGTINSSGLYTAPSSITVQQTVTVTATSQADNTKTGTATITLLPPVVKQTPVITWATPAPITYGTALSATQLDATANVGGTFAYSPAAGTVPAAGSQTLSVTFTPTNTTNYTTATASVVLTVNKAVPVLTWATPAPITYGMALSATQLDATANVGGTFAYSPAAGTVPAAGSQTLSVTFTPTNTTNYTTATASVVLTVNKAVPVLTWGTPAPITYGMALSATQLDATANVQGSFVYSPAAGAVLTASSQTLSVTFTPTNTTNYTTATASVVLTVNKAVPVLTWATPAPITYGTALNATQLDATANVQGTFVYSPAAGTVLTAGSQTLRVTFTPTDSTDYTTATASVVLTVNKAVPVLTWATPAPITYGTALSATQLDATANVQGSFIYSPASGAVLTAGSQTLSVTFTPTDSTDYTTATTSVVLTVNKAVPVLTWATPAPITYGTALSATQLDATANVQGSFVYSPASGAVLTAGSQTLSVTFTPTDSTDYTTATTSVVLTVNKAVPVLTWATPAPITYGTALSATQLDATANVAGTFAYSPAAGTVPSAGSQTLSVSFTPTDSTDYTTATASAVLTVNKAVPVLTWATPAPITYGTALSATQLDATANVAGTFAYSPAAGTVPSAGSQTLSVSFTPTDSTDYTTATTSVVLTVNKAVPVLTWATPAPITYGTALSATQLDATANVAGTFAYSPAAGTVPAAGSQTLSVSFTPTDSTDYTTATASVVLTVSQVTPTITWATPAPITYGTALSATQLDATASVAGAFVYSPVLGAVLTAGSQTLNVTFTPTDTTDYTTAISSVTLTVNPASQCSSGGYSYVRAITVSHTQVPNTDQINFPFLFNTTDPTLASTANGGHVTSPTGADIIFAADPAGQTVLNFELEEYNPVSGQVVAWVNIPMLSHTSDTAIYVLYGNSNVTTSAQNPSAVWDANYMGVWHVPNGTQLSLADSTRNGNNGTDNGATATPGQIDGGMATNGTTYATIGTPADLANLAQGNVTFSAWVNPSVALAGYPSGGIIMGKDDANISSGWTLGLDWSNYVDFSVIFNEDNFYLSSSQPVPFNQWSYIVVTLNGSSTLSQATLYVNGVPSGNGSGGYAQTTDDSADVAYLANATFGDRTEQPLNGVSDEFRISKIVRTPDWISTEYANQSSPSSFYNLSAEGVFIAPASGLLYQGQSQQFQATLLASCTSGIIWSITPAGAGTIDQTGLYTAPASITTQQTILVTATSQANPSVTASAMVTLMPPVAVSVTPATATISNGSEQQQFSAAVTNTSNTVVTWSLSPTGAGTIDQTGLYTAPGSIASQQTVTITATSQFDTTKSGSATVTLVPPVIPPPICTSNGYSFVRAIVVNHNLVPNTDQANFPFLFNSTDPAFATTANGGHITNEDATDIIFTSDPAGLNQLNYELEEYNPVSGQVIAWINIPNLSHSADTVLYMFYGNPLVATSPQNPTAVWDSNFMGVWHVANGTVLSLADSTVNGNNGTNNGEIASPGQIDGGMGSNYQSTANVGAAAGLANLAHGNATFSGWVYSTGYGGMILGKGGFSDGGWTLGVNYSQQLELMVYDANVSGGYVGSSLPIGQNQWYYVTATISQIASNPTQSTMTLYVDGIPAGTETLEFDSPVDDTPYAAILGGNTYGDFDDQVEGAINGTMDEFRISNIARSSDWIATEYNSQSSPSSFYQLYSENQTGVVPSTTTLYAAQAAQFTDVTTCGAAAVNWSIPAGSPGALTTGGLYTAPSSISTQQSITVTAANQTDGSTAGTATISLMPPMSISLVPTTATVQVPQTQQFTATIANSNLQGVTWSINPSYLGSISPTGLYTPPQYLYQSETGTITATSQANPSLSATATLTVLPPITLSISPQYSVLYSGMTQQFTATVANTSNTAVTWSISPAGAGTIDNTGFYTAPLTQTPQQTVSITATSQANSSAVASTTIILNPPITVTVTPPTAILLANQSVQFDASVSLYNGGCGGSGCVTWSVSPAGLGTIGSYGSYTAPASIGTGQTVTVIGTYQVGNVSATAAATITLVPNTPAISVSPQTITLMGGQTQQYSATITNGASNAVNWSISPTGTGTFSTSGLYTTPPVITTQQVFTITATSQANPSLTATATLTIVPTDCAANSYGYERSIVIDHTNVPGSDQPKFPFYFAVTDPLLATTVNGGHMASPNGYDIQFSTDPAGLHTLGYELEQYNPVTGQVVAWVQVPVLSHTQDTVLYMFYGNAAITASQQNPAGVWDSSYAAVYQFDNLQSASGFGFVPDSTTNGNTAFDLSVQSGSGQPGGAAIFDGASSIIELPSNDFASYPVSGSSGAVFNSTVGVWFKTSASGVILGQDGSATPGSYPNGWIPALYIDTDGYLRTNFFDLQNGQQVVSSTRLNDNNWHYAVLSFDTDQTTNTIGFYGGVSSTTSGLETVYVDGRVIGSQDGLIPTSFNSSYSYFLGSGYAQGWPSTSSAGDGWFYFNGSLDQVEVSSIARSGGWVRAEYLNQSSPSTFFTLSPEVGPGGSLNPLAVTLYSSQRQQFTVLETGMCNAGNAIWSIPAGSPGTLSSTGLYTAPTTIDTPQTVTVTATTLGANSAPLSATITLMPPVGVTVSPGAVSVPAGGTQQFTATVSNATNTGVIWSLAPAGAGSLSSSGLYTAPAIPSAQTVYVIAISLADPTQSASATVTIGVPAPAVPAITVNPQTALLYAGNTLQLVANVTNTGNTSVTWSISPAGTGTIDQTGLYTAPSSITSQQTVVVTATSQANPAVSATATVDLAPAHCTSNGYSYVRAITIDHTRIPNTDQTNFPFLFSTTDPLLASASNGGHVTNPNGYDIFFTSDSAGQSPLNYEMESYNPGTGQVIAWVQIPVLSHTSDTVVYMYYGNPGVTTSQQNASGVWDGNYGGVWHLGGDGSVVSTADSTANSNNATLDGSASAGPGQFGYGAMLNGSGYFDAGNQPGVQPTHTGTMSVWINPVMFPGYVIPIGNGDTSGFPEYGAMITMGSNGVVQFTIDNTYWADGNSVSSGPLAQNRWYYLAATWDGNSVNLFENGALVSSSAQSIDASPSYDLKLGWGLDGSIEEARVSQIARSADWIAAEYNNQNSPSTFFAQSAENLAGIAPNSVALYANQSQQFAAPGLCSAGVTWTLSADAEGTLTQAGLYTAPAEITQQQTVVVTATSHAGPGQSASATVTLLPPVSVTISPISITLNPNQTQQFTSTVINSPSQAVIWTISPAGAGSVDQTGAYIAPSSISTQQTVTVTATSQSDPTKSASAMITLAPSTCASIGYGYQRVIVIDHTKVANTDQVNYPFLFNSTDQDLATVDKGGHVTNPNGYDLIFSSDPNGQTKLDFEVEQYNPATGQLVAWIRIPTLSHSSDTVIYLFYGNPAIAASQANPTGVWDSNYQAVYHLGNLPSTELAADSTNYANSASFLSLTPSAGQIDGGASLDGVVSYLEIPATAFPSYPVGVYTNIGVNTTWNNATFAATYGIWFKTPSWGGLLDQTAGDSCVSIFGICLFSSPEQPGTNPYGSWGGLLDISFDGNLEGRGVGPSPQTYNDNNWHYATITFENGANKLYADGQQVATGQGGTFGFAANYAYFVGTEDIQSDTSSLDSRPWRYLSGKIDEINVSSTARSGDWIQTQFNNQSSPSTFYAFYSPSAIQVAPSAISLYAGQSEQFAVPGSCDASVVWSMPYGAPGTLSAAGLYTAPTPIAARQTVTVNATSQPLGASLGSAQVTLLPPPQPINLSASSPSPYSTGSSQTFTATLLDPQGNPQIGVAVSFTVAGPNEGSGSGTTDSNGNATYSYTGTNSGTDTIQASAPIDGALLTSNSVTAAWLTPPPVRVPTVSLLPQPSPGRGALVGAFTDSNGAVIEAIVVGTAARTFITPAGATRLQLGINDNYYEDNGGSGFVISVNGVNVTVPPTAMPWNWQAGGLNNDYQYGIKDGTSPIVAAANLTAGQNVTLAYQNGTVTTDNPIRSLVDANGETSFITGTQLFQGTYFPTLYTTGTSYPEGQPITVFALVTDATGAPIPNAPVTLNVSGANPGQYQATTDPTGTVAFLYTGLNAGNDSLRAQAANGVQGTITSNQTAIVWTYYPTPPPVGSLSLTYILTVVNNQSFSSYVRDASGNPLPNVNVGFYVTGVDTFQSSSNSNDLGQSTFGYYHTQSGNYSIIAVESVGRNVIVTQPVTGTWTVPSGPPTTSGGSISVGISANTYVTFPNALQLNGSVTDSSGVNPTTNWTEISGPGVVTFADTTQTVTTATFSVPGTYVVQLYASDGTDTGWAQFTVSVVMPSVASQSQGWIGKPAFGSVVSGIVPITLAPGVSLTGGTLSYIPANNPDNVTVLNANVSGSGQIGALDTTMLANGSYWIQMQATDTSGSSQYSLVLVTATGNYKPGRVTTTVTDLVVPATGLPIQIQRTYDSLNAGTSGDFGYGWNLGINVDLSVDPSGNVTFTLGGQRKTFYLTPQMPPCTIVGCLVPYYFVAFTPEPGLHGSLTDSSQGCPLDIVVPNGSLWECQGGTGPYDPPGYIYTDPNGTQYTISAGGALQSVFDHTGNGLTITPNGITSTTGLNVPFVRDSQNRITQITDPQGNIYQYGYDQKGNLATVTYPSTPQPSTYTYDANHFYLSGTDFRNNPLPSTGYYTSSDTDPSGLPLNGRLHTVTDGLGETTTYAYDLVANSTTITYPADASGNVGTATMVYDNNGNLLTSTDPLGHTTTNVYDAHQNLTSVTDPLGHTTSYTYDANGNKTSQTYPATATSTDTTSTTAYNQYSEPTSTTDELGNVRTFNYDASYNPQSITDSIGTLASFIFNTNQTLQAGAIGYDITQSPSRASQFAYDADGNMTSKTDALGRITSYTYNALGQKLTMTEPVPSGSNAAAATTTYQYDAFGNLTQTSAPLGRITTSQYDANGNKISDIDARGNKTMYAYDALNRPILTTYPDTTTSSKTYDFRGKVITETDQAGHVTQHQYDLAGRQIAVTQAFGTASAQTTGYTLDAAGRKTAETDALGHATSYTYDAANNLTAMAGVKGNFQYAYDNARNQVAMTDADGNTTQYQYDARKRLTVTTFPDQTTRTNAYDGPGNLASVTDQAGNQVQYTYDPANQLKTVVQANSPNSPANTTMVGYDAEGNPTTVVDANTHLTASSFDLLGELTAKTLPDATHTETRQYDQNGNLTSLTHFNGVTTTYTYDNLNRLLSRTTSGEAAVGFTYTATGKRQTMTDGSGTTTYSYDSMDRLTTKATPEGTLSYTYDAAGNLASMSSNHTNGASVTYSYDDLNRLTSVVDNRLSGQNTTTYSYDSASNLGTVTYPNTIQTAFTYDQLNRVSSAASPVAGYSYRRGPTGNLTNVVELNGRTVNWSYDGIYRLTNETIANDPAKNNGAVSYGLDPVGNRLSESSSLDEIPSGSWGFNSDDEISSESYDANGNVTAASGKTFAYDSENHLVSMNGGAVQIVYDGDGNRVSKSVNGVLTRYLVDDLNQTGYAQVVEELSGAGVVERQYAYGLQRISQNQPIDNTWTVSFYGYDGGGSVRNLTNTVGAVTDTYEYDAFGNEFTLSGTTPNNYLYRGEQYDSDLGLYYLRARYYNPATGRFLSRDPQEGAIKYPASLHKYLYAEADPIDRLDPMGTAAIFQYQILTWRRETIAAKVATDIGIKVAACYVAVAGTIVADLEHSALGTGIGGAATVIDCGILAALFF